MIDSRKKLALRISASKWFSLTSCIDKDPLTKESGPRSGANSPSGFSPSLSFVHQWGSWKGRAVNAAEGLSAAIVLRATIAFVKEPVGNSDHSGTHLWIKNHCLWHWWPKNSHILQKLKEVVSTSYLLKFWHLHKIISIFFDRPAWCVWVHLSISLKWPSAR